MSINNVINDFRSISDFTKHGEVELFRNFSKAIVKNTNSIFIDETHGATKCNVEFKFTTGNQTRCEIADLLIITKSNNNPFLRATFWQAKKQKNSKWINRSSADHHVDFKGQFNQWDLLNRRPEISGVNPFTPPLDLLSSFESPSIGSFGIFYERNSEIEIMHSVAEFVTCYNPSAANPTLVANAHLDKYNVWLDEIIVKKDLLSFLDSLFNHQVGALLDPSDSRHNWIVSYAKAKALATKNITQQQINNFFDANEPPREFDISMTGGGMSILLVDTTEFKKKA